MKSVDFILTSILSKCNKLKNTIMHYRLAGKGSLSSAKPSMHILVECAKLQGITIPDGGN